MEGVRYAPGLVWTPDSKQFLFRFERAKSRGASMFRIFRERPPRPFASGEFRDRRADLAGRQVALLNAQPRGWFLYPVTGGEPRPIPGIGPDVIDVLRWDGSGRALFLRKEKPPGVEIWRLDVETGRQEKIATIGPSTGRAPKESTPSF